MYYIIFNIQPMYIITKENAISLLSLSFGSFLSRSFLGRPLRVQPIDPPRFYPKVNQSIFPLRLFKIQPPTVYFQLTQPSKNPIQHSQPTKNLSKSKPKLP